MCDAAVYTAIAASDPLFVSGCASGGGPTPVDLRCQGAASDVCGCIKVSAISETPYYGCVMSGYAAEDSLPLVTLPGVVENLPQPACDAPDRVKRFIPTSAHPTNMLCTSVAGTTERCWMFAYSTDRLRV